MLRLSSLIQIGSQEFDFTNNIQAEESWEDFTDLCSIVIPNKFRYKDKPIINNKTPAGDSVFKRGDAVKIFVGYFPNRELVYQGFVSRVIPDAPLTIECQDAMWKLKQTNFKISFEKRLLADLLDEITKDKDGARIIEFEAIDTALGQFRINQASAVQILEEIKSKYSIFSYVEDGILKVGLPHLETVDDARKHNFNFQKNVIGSDLEYLRADDVNIAIKLVNLTKDNKKVERYVLFDLNGNITVVNDKPNDYELRTLHFYETSTADMIEAGKRKLPDLIYEGYRGSFTTFGEPVVKHGDVVVLKDNRYPERDGEYFARRVTRMFGMDGYRQVIELDTKAA